MSSGPRTVVDISMYGAGAASKVGYMNKSDGATPLCHMGTFSGACYDYRCYLLISICARRCMPLTKRLERHGDLFLDSVSKLFFGGEISDSRELLEDNSSSLAALLLPGRMGSLPLFCLTGGARWSLACAFSPRSSSKRARRKSFSCYRWSTRFSNSAICLAYSSCFISIS